MDRPITWHDRRVSEARSLVNSFVTAVSKRLAQGVPVPVFPEGRIGWGNKLLPSRTGAFEAAVHHPTCSLYPVFVDVKALENKPTPGAEGRRALSLNRHDSIVAHLVHLLSYRHIDVEIRFGIPLKVKGLERKALARTAYEAVSARQHHKTYVTLMGN